MSSLVRIHIKAHGVLEGDLEDIVTIDLPTIGEVDVILDRDSMGRIIFKESRARPNLNWLAQSEVLLAAMERLHSEACKITAAANLTLDELFKTKRMLDGKQQTNR